MLSDDGRTLLITEAARAADRDTASPPEDRRIARSAPRHGEGLALSPDGKWVIAQKIKKSPDQLVLMPTGAGEARALTKDDIMHRRGVPARRQAVHF